MIAAGMPTDSASYPAFASGGMRHERHTNSGSFARSDRLRPPVGLPGAGCHHDPDEVEWLRGIYHRLFEHRAGRVRGDQFDLCGTDNEGKEART